MRGGSRRPHINAVARWSSRIRFKYVSKRKSDSQMRVRLVDLCVRIMKTILQIPPTAYLFLARLFAEIQNHDRKRVICCLKTNFLQTWYSIQRNAFQALHFFSLLWYTPRREAEDVSPLSGISRLSFDSALLSPFWFFCYSCSFFCFAFFFFSLHTGPFIFFQESVLQYFSWRERSFARLSFTR